MLTAIKELGARRMWFVPDFMVWGTTGLGEIEFLACETVGSSSAVYFAQTDIGDSAQTVPFSNLTDHRGNHLPDTLSSPRVIPRSRESAAVFVLGQETGESFKIARDSEISGPVRTDLLIIEMGD